MLKKKLLALFVSVMMLLSLAGCTVQQNAQAKTQTQAVQVSQKIQVAQPKPVQTPSGKTMLVDAGVPEMGSRVISYIRSRKH